jgi:hypothetical protein
MTNSLPGKDQHWIAVSFGDGFTRFLFLRKLHICIRSGLWAGTPVAVFRVHHRYFLLNKYVFLL